MICSSIDPSSHHLYFTNPFVKAIRQDAIEVVKEILYEFPDEVWSVNEDGLRFAGSKDGSAHDFLNSYVVAFLNEIKPLSVNKLPGFPRGLSQYVDRGTLKTCLHLIALSLSVVMAGSGHLQTFKLLTFLRCRNSVDGHVNYGTQTAVRLIADNKLMGGSLITEGCFWMLNVVELFLIGDPVDLVVALEKPGLEVKKLTRVILEDGPPYVNWSAQMAVGQNTREPWMMCKQQTAPDPVINTSNGMRCDEKWEGPNSPNKPSLWTENWTSLTLNSKTHHQQLGVSAIKKIQK